jgi:nitrite reductase/ring-hydroxylating ferredoxin subunit
MAFVEVIPLARCRPNGGTFVALGDHELAVFRLGDPQRVVVIDNSCPHASGNLSGGVLTGSVVQCPSHQWAFDLDRGVCTHSELARVRQYPVELRDGVVWVDIDGSETERARPIGDVPAST